MPQTIQLTDALDSSAITAIKNFCTDFCQQNNPVPRWVMGRNEYAQMLADAISIEGFIDDFTHLNQWQGKPVVSADNVAKNSLVINTSTAHTLVAQTHLNNLQLRNLDFYAFYLNAPLRLPAVSYFSGFTEDFKNNQQKYQWVYSLLQDDLSRDTFRKLLNYRTSGDSRFLQNFSFRIQQQYFDCIRLKNADETFLDVGSYDGQSSIEFIRYCPDYTSIHIFEPEMFNEGLCRKKLQNYPNIFFYPYGLSDRKDILRFSALGSASQISSKGTQFIHVDCLDNLLQSGTKPTFIKMDIEGAELPAIAGAEKTIARYHPTLALSIYHKVGDYWKIPEAVFSIRDDYSVYIRHYIEGLIETVMYFVPPGRQLR